MPRPLARLSLLVKDELLLIKVVKKKATLGLMHSEENGFLYMGVEAPGSYYLVFLVPGAGNVILSHAFLLSAGLENKPSMLGGGADEGLT